MLLVCFDIQVKDKENEKIENCKDLKRELKRIWKLRKVTVVPIIIGALGTVSNDIKKWLTEIGVTCRLESFESPWKVNPNRGLYIGRTTNGCILLIIVFPSNPSQVARLCHLLDGIFVVLEIRNKKQTDLTGQCNPAGSCYPFLSLTIGDKIVVKND